MIMSQVLIQNRLEPRIFRARLQLNVLSRVPFRFRRERGAEYGNVELFGG